MERMTGIDPMFIYSDTPETPMEVAYACVFDPSTTQDGYSFERVRALLEERIPEMAPFRRRLMPVPLGLDHPRWVDDPDFDIVNHLHRVALPAPGGEAEFAQMVSAVMGRPLIAGQPPWEMHVIEELAGGMVGLIAKVHHAVIDGVAGAQLFAQLLDLTPDLNRKATRLTADAKQKISLGRGLVRSDVAAVLFDEPLTVIDPELKWQLRSKLKALHRELDLTMIYVTHDQTEALTFADTVVVIHDGRVVQSGTPAELFGKPTHTFVGYFIGSPGMNIVPAEVSGREARIDGHVIALNRTYSGLNGAKIEIGVRPEFVDVATPAPDLLSAKIERIDDLGRMRFARVRVGDAKFAARMPQGFSPSGDTAGLRFDPAHVHVYVDSLLVEGMA